MKKKKSVLELNTLNKVSIIEVMMCETESMLHWTYLVQLTPIRESLSGRLISGWVGRWMASSLSVSIQAAT